MGEVRVELMAYDREGKPVNWASQTMGIKLDPGNFTAIEKAGLPAHIEIDLPQTDVFLAAGVLDLSTGKTGTVEIPLLSNATLALSQPGAAQQTMPKNER
jgi:hypothetical protein